MSLANKLGRVARLRHLLGLRGALALEVAWTVGRPLLHVQVPGYRQPFVLRRAGADRSAFEQVFLEEGCAVPFMAAPPRTVVEGSAHVGFASAWFAERYPKATVIALEPSAGSCALLRQNTRSYPNVRVLRAALWSRSATLRVRNPDAPPWSRQVEECAAGTPGSFEAVSVQDLLDQTSDGVIDVLELDVEAAQRVLFSVGVDDWIERVRSFVIDLRTPGADALVLGALRSRSFSERVRGQKAIFQRAPAPTEGRTSPILPPEPAPLPVSEVSLR